MNCKNLSVPSTYENTEIPIKSSWQARLFCVISRLTLKRLVRHSSIESLRKRLGFFDKLGKSETPCNVTVSTVRGQNFDGLWIRPPHCDEQRVVLYFPGGAFVTRTPLSHRLLLARLCVQAEAQGLMVNYRLAPEHPFPAALEDCVAAYNYLLAQGYDPHHINIAGDSAGGNLVLSTLLRLERADVPMPSSAVMLSPLLDLTFAGKSRTVNAKKDPMLTNDRSYELNDIYHPGFPADHPEVSPVFASFTKLPAILNQVGSSEILLDDSRRAAANAEKAGSPYHLEIWPDMPHVWHLIPFIPESETAIKSIGKFIILHTRSMAPPTQDK